jgi:hypothetical protein
MAIISDHEEQEDGSGREEERDGDEEIPTTESIRRLALRTGPTAKTPLRSASASKIGHRLSIPRLGFVVYSDVFSGLFPQLGVCYLNWVLQPNAPT